MQSCTLKSCVAAFYCAVFLLATSTGLGQTAQTPPQPQPFPYPPTLPVPVDRPYLAAIQLTVDLTHLMTHVQHVNETIPVGHMDKELILLYPEWIPGVHAPSGTLSRIAGIVTKVDGKRVQWVRDRVNVWAFHVPLPAGSERVELDFDYLSPVRSLEGRVEMSDTIATIDWNEVAMYPAGYFSRDIPFDVTVRIPDGWKYASALSASSEHGSQIDFKRTPLNTLIDSPLYAGAYYKQLDLSPTATNIVHLDLFADEQKDLSIAADDLARYRQLIIEAVRLFASQHYDRYDFLMLLSDKVADAGLEHHQCSAIGAPASFFSDLSMYTLGVDFLGHEYVHSWNGKFRRPANLWTPNLNVPMIADLLWVYEGLTQYWGDVLAARAGLRTVGETRDIMARNAANFEVNPGRDWRPAIDTTQQPMISQQRPLSWVSWQRSEDYYYEGELIWLAVDTKIRELSDDRKSLDDFGQAFFGIYNHSFVTQTYTLDELIRVLNSVAPFDWATFVREHIYEVRHRVPLEGFSTGGYKLVYSDSVPAWMEKANLKPSHADFSTSLGFSVALPSNGAADAPIGAVWWESPAFKAGIMPDMRLVSVNAKAFSAEVLREAILEAEHNKRPLQLLFRRGKEYINISLPYFDGLRIPSLERVDGTPDRLDDILSPSKRLLPN